MFLLQRQQVVLPHEPRNSTTRCVRCEVEAHSRISNLNPWLACVPYISSDDKDFDGTVDAVAKHYCGEFCWATSFDARFVSKLMSRGFLTMAQRAGDQCFALLPKLHRERCALKFKDRHTSKSVRRHAKKFRMTVDTNFDAVVEGIQHHHGDECWLYPPLVAAFRTIFIDPPHPSIAMHTFECWKDNELVAGELGYACGDVYTSLSGFSTFPCAGSVQCAATAAWLEISGYALWDLGMELPYKLALGAKPMPRSDFLAAIDKARSLSSGALPLANGACGERVKFYARPLIDDGHLTSSLSSSSSSEKDDTLESSSQSSSSLPPKPTSLRFSFFVSSSSSSSRVVIG